ncbi:MULTISPECIES: histidinol dehydrogenase [unclassified Microbacterium]|uniref:histidinol dehydrogenase n=1 Tax=unclassified Microbacterium TaxID=2609290 RepID=UPI001D3C9C15|nr:MULTISPECIES: histidinol dehydrogenase [unclassified Microbacterium]CAH0168592.1 Histidinol dehydrogenase [Microbacterium sp. Bi121]HWK77983.1 histidinol dehydrogenase [Microbacterium sp.]
MRTIDLRGRELSPADMLAAVPRAAQARAEALETAARIVDDVRTGGEAALRTQADKFDRVSGHEIRVPASHIQDAVTALAPEIRAALEEAIRRVRQASAAQVPETRVTRIGDGALITQRWQPVSRVGVYIPGGKAVYPSSVIMNVVPAQVAGVQQIALASPAQEDQDGRVHPVILAAAGLLGITEVYAMGGAGAIGAFAHGVAGLGLDPVDVVSGPGNNYVASAKRAVAGVVGTDSEAGATEILIVADSSADARLIAADLVSQAEHDEQASAVLVTDDEALAERVAAEVVRFAASTKHAQRVGVSLAGEQSAIVLVDDRAMAAAFSNAYAPEHLELHLEDASEAASDFTSAGAIFVGDQTPVSLGDYMAGSNHVLPTGGQARYAPGLGAYTFLRPQQIISYDHAALAAVREGVVALANTEVLPAHGEAIEARFQEPEERTTTL